MPKPQKKNARWHRRHSIDPKTKQVRTRVEMIDRPFLTQTINQGLNRLCPCNSGKKYKRCCLAKDQSVARAKIESKGIPTT